MPSEYEALVEALGGTSIPFAEYGWRTRPEGAYGVVSLDFEADAHNGDGAKIDRVWEGSVDVFFQKLDDRGDMIEAVEEVLSEVLGNSWSLNSTQYETETGLFHIEWVFRCLDEPEADEAEEGGS